MTTRSPRFVVSGAEMRTAVVASSPEPPVTVAEIDEALAHTITHAADWANQLAMSKWVDALLDQRLRLTKGNR